MRLNEGQIQWTKDLTGSTASGVFPTASDAGVQVDSNGAHAGRVHIMARIQCTSTVNNQLSARCHVYGYGVDTAGTATWGYINSLIGGNSVVTDYVKGGDTSTAVIIEALTYTTGEPVYATNFQRIATRLVLSTNHIATTWVGVALG